MTKGKNSTNVNLSKSLFILGLQCHKSLYMHKHHPELKDKISEEQEALFQVGYEVGDYAKQLFPGGVEIPYVANDYTGQVERTNAEIDKGTNTIYEATFTYDNIFVKLDILRKGKEGWEIYEVKSSTGIKDVYFDDASIQYYVAQGSGLTVSKTSVVYINNQYVRDGDIDPKKLFVIDDITDKVKEKQSFIVENIKKLKEVLVEDMPVIDIGKHCSEPYPCDFQGHCWQHIPEDSVFDLKRKGVDKFALYRKGIVEMKDIPLDILNKCQRTQAEAFIQKREIVDKKAIRDFLGTLWYPMYFLDFETFYTPIPLLNGVSPYQQVPFQYSLHSLSAANAELKHSEFIASPGEDSRRALLNKLLADIPAVGCIISYTDFETKRLRELSRWLPEYTNIVDLLIGNLRDLAEPFKQKIYYHWMLNGSYSLKAVLPCLLPDMGYESLEIRNGGMAIDAYFKMQESKDTNEIEKIRRDLLEYCKLDTFAMVRILEKLREISA